MSHYYASVFLLVTAFAAPLPGLGQEQPIPPLPHRPALFRLGVGSSMNGSGDFPVLKAHLEYAPQFGQHVRLGSRLAYIGNSSSLQLDAYHSIPQSYHALNMEQEIYWVPFGVNRLVEFGVGGGLVAGYSKLSSYSSAGYSPQGYFYVPAVERGFHVGYIASLYADVALNQTRTWRLGGRLALQNDTQANILPGAQFTLSRAW